MKAGYARLSEEIAAGGLRPLPCAESETDMFLSAPPAAVVSMVGRVSGDFMVLGAAGKMGLHVALMLRRALDARGDPRRVMAVSRFSNPKAREEFQSCGIEAISCDLSVEEELAGLPDARNIIFMAGAKFGTADNPGLLKRMNEDMPSMVAERFSSSVITAFSTGCVYSYASVETTGATEQFPTEPVGAYALSCLGRERAFRRVAAGHGTRVALIRLNYSVEFRYGVPVDIAGKILSGEPIDLSMGYANLIWQRDAVCHSLLAHEMASTEPFVINVTGRNFYRVRDIAEHLGKLLGKKPVFRGTEEKTAWISDASKAIRLFGEPEVSVEQMLGWIAAWQNAGLATLNKPTGFEKRDGNF
jgi:nucleoside-diphosphate-sugar epimerase